MKNTSFAERIMPVVMAACKVIEETVAEAQEAACGRMAMLEDCVSEVMEEVSAAMMQESVEMSLPEIGHGHHPCACGRTARFSRNASRKQVTTQGEIRLRRTYFYCAHCRTGFAPEDELYGIDGTKFTARAAEEVVRLGVHSASYVDAAEELAHRDISVSREQVRRMCNAVGLELDKQMKEGTWPRKCEQNVQGQVYASSDGGMVNTQTGWREIKMTQVYNQDKSLRRCGCHLGDAKPLGRFLRRHARELGVRETDQLVSIGDGAPWIWNLMEKSLPGSQWISDFYHASEHLTLCAHSVFGEGTKDARKWLKRANHRLKHEGGRKVCQWMRRWRPHLPEQKRKVVDQLLTYLVPRQDRMDYPKYIQQGLDIGSGPIESAIKGVIGARLKGPGMRWTAHNATAIGQLRCLKRSGRWNDLRETILRR